MPLPPNRVVYGLTQRQYEAWRMVAQGDSDQAIARRMDIEWGTVRCHLREVYRAIGTRNRVQAALLWHGIYSGVSRTKEH